MSYEDKKCAGTCQGHSPAEIIEMRDSFCKPPCYDCNNPVTHSHWDQHRDGKDVWHCDVCCVPPCGYLPYHKWMRLSKREKERRSQESIRKNVQAMREKRNAA